MPSNDYLRIIAMDLLNSTMPPHSHYFLRGIYGKK
jgi:hypothetical protein